MRFLRENWLWIVVPIAVVLLGLVLFLLLFPEQEAAPFDYPIF